MTSKSEIDNQFVSVQRFIAPVSIGTAAGTPTLLPTAGSIVQDPTNPGKIYVGNGTAFSGSIDPAIIINGNNTGVGTNDLASLTSGMRDTAVGFQSQPSTTTGSDNTSVGFQSLFNNTTGSTNTAVGSRALGTSTTASNNSANGYQSLLNNTSGADNTANGYQSGTAISTGSNNALLGSGAGSAITIGSSNICVGASAGNALTTGSNNIDIGNVGVAGESGTIRIGTNGTHTVCVLQGVSGATSAAGVAVLVNATGVLGTTTSSIRYKKNIIRIKQEENCDKLMQLIPVRFHYKQDDDESPKQFGLIAEDVDEVDKDLVCYKNGIPETVYYQHLPLMLLTEIQRLNEELTKLKQKLDLKSDKC